MKILNLKTQGYRSLKDISWQPGNLNVLIGPNGSGKSNLLRLLELISISAKGQLGKHIQKSRGHGTSRLGRNDRKHQFLCQSLPK